MVKSFVPECGDIVWLQFNPQAGHEQAGRRPALILSPRGYNDKTSLALCCPLTTRIKGYPFEVELPDGSDATGAVLSDQVKSVDWRARQASLMGQAPDEVVDAVRERVSLLLQGK